MIVKITKKGSITLPDEILRKIKTDTLEVSFSNGNIIMKPVKLGGVLKKYSKKSKNINKIIKLEKKAFEDALCQKHSNR